MEQLYNVIDLTTDPPTVVEETLNYTEQQCLDWIDQYGNIIYYSIEPQK